MLRETSEASTIAASTATGALAALRLGRLGECEREHERGAKRQVDPQASAHQSLLHAPPSKHTATSPVLEGARTVTLI